MRIVGRDADGHRVFRAPLPHGDTPESVAYDAGYVMERTTRAARGADGDLELELVVRLLAGEPSPRRGTPGRDRTLVIAPGEEPEPRQRVAAYALVSSTRGLLATQYSDRTAVEGRWGMPGGGLDATEEPVAAVLREVNEETAQTVVLAELETVQTSHWLGRNPSGTLEDFHAIRLVYRADCPEPTEPRVLDTGGTTSDARWVALEEWTRLDWTPGWRAILTEYLAPGPAR